jgi:hypothetical protein
MNEVDFLEEHAARLDKHAMVIERTNPAYFGTKVAYQLLEAHRRQLIRMRDEAVALARQFRKEDAGAALQKAMAYQDMADCLDDPDSIEEAVSYVDFYRAKARAVLEG